ncbi:FtsW/RodA/SpoVE family cell cycle protein [Candidatus Riesia pediculischaeffi]|uniref:Probable peptidoglycan glycosyltransferase FtsW n=1 Tax=Candidatus Riesia pediculischaeffi TaxID=428411 RepID=A0A1V0HK36_9ENTR|nr:FtsW/RodA/SpoVE family cell cycle protein [Candidatus Riesia pediculischaeffi]ARC53188.1 hypothetical protein AOQ87_00525 [Candidatus Riesia pediculischaeffi]
MKRSYYNRSLLLVTMILLIFSIVMVGSSSVNISDRVNKDYLYFFKKNVIHSIVCIITMICVSNVPIYKWKKYKGKLIIFSITLLFLSNHFGIVSHGARRWINIKIVNVQPSELIKITFSFYLSEYLSKKYKQIFSTISFIFILFIISNFLLSQPDFGTLAILCLSSLFLFLLIGKRIVLIVIGNALLIIAFFISIYFHPYRVKRITSLLDPWSNYLGSGYQLVHSMISLGIGGFFGKGVGNSIQKLTFLPEPHTDFIISIIGEELGYFGIVMVTISLFFIFFQGMKINRKKCFTRFAVLPWIPSIFYQLAYYRTVHY